jgi:hypothetical protein
MFREFRDYVGRQQTEINKLCVDFQNVIRGEVLNSNLFLSNTRNENNESSETDSD